MRVKVKPLECTGCALCELACGYHWDEAFSLISSSIMLYRAEEKKDYMGIIVKTDEDLFIGRPEGAEAVKIGDLQKIVAPEASHSPMGDAGKGFLIR